MMNIEEALVVLDAALEDNFLSNIQELVFRQAWDGKTYSEIAENCGYEANYIKNVGYKLWSLLSTVFAEEVTKSNFRVVIRRYYYENLNHRRSLHNTTEQSSGDRAIFGFDQIDKLVESANFLPIGRLTNTTLNITLTPEAEMEKTDDTPIKPNLGRIAAKNNVSTLQKLNQQFFRCRGCPVTLPQQCHLAAISSATK